MLLIDLDEVHVGQPVADRLGAPEDDVDIAGVRPLGVETVFRVIAEIRRA